MTDHDPTIAPTAEQNPEKPPIHFVDFQAGHIKRMKKYLEVLEEQSPGSFNTIDDATLEVQQMCDPRDPFTTYPHYLLRKIFFERAVYNIETTREMNERIYHGLMDMHTLESVAAVDKTIAAITPTHDKSGEPIDTELAFETLAIPVNATEIARRKAVKLSHEGAVGQPFSELETEVTELYLATLFTGNPAAYSKSARACTSALTQVRTHDPVGADLADYAMILSPKLYDKLHELDHTSDSSYETFLRFNLLLTFRNAMQNVTKREAIDLRTAMLNFAQRISFNNELTAQLAAAYEASEPTLLDREMEQLDWEPLPPGTLSEAAREIVANHIERTGKSAYIDLDRLQTLVNVQQWWGEDRSYFAKGVRKKRHAVRSNGKVQPDEYILLVLQHADAASNLTPKDNVVAESPIAGRHALYVQRHDINGRDWRELMALPKEDVIAAGGRQVKHNIPAGQDLVENLTAKTIKLLTCSAEEFRQGNLESSRSGHVRLRIPRRVLASALQEDV